MGWVREHGNLVVLRTFSKSAGLAGLRVGWGAFPAWTARCSQRPRVSLLRDTAPGRDGAAARHPTRRMQLRSGPNWRSEGGRPGLLRMGGGMVCAGVCRSGMRRAQAASRCGVDGQPADLCRAGAQRVRDLLVQERARLAAGLAAVPYLAP